jgi:uncharacterized membrane protein
LEKQQSGWKLYSNSLVVVVWYGNIAQENVGNTHDMTNRNRSLRRTHGRQITLVTFLGTILLFLFSWFSFRQEQGWSVMGCFFWFVIIMMIVATCHTINIIIIIIMNEETFQQDQWKKRYNTCDADDILEEIKNCHDDDDDDDDHDSIVRLEAALESLITKVTTSSSSNNNNNKRLRRRNGNVYEPHELELACQEAAYLAIQKNCGRKSDLILSTAISLLALVAKDTAVRERFLISSMTTTTTKTKTTTLSRSTNNFHIRILLQIIQSSLWRIIQQQAEEEEEQQQQQADHEDEILAAQVQRKSFLWMGALADQNPKLASLLVDEGGMDCIKNAMDWFRHHSQVNNWGLWAIFQLCLDHTANQAEWVRKGGLSITCRAIQIHHHDSSCDESSSSSSLDICRHGLAILYDILRQPPNHSSSTSHHSPYRASILTHQISELRKIAIAAGLHDAVYAAMVAHPDSREVMGMGTEILVSTGFRGPIIPMHPPMS